MTIVFVMLRLSGDPLGLLAPQDATIEELAEIRARPSASTAPCGRGDNHRGASSLTYDANTGQYKYVWKSEKIWGDTCRQLVIKLKDNAEHLANFTFKK